MESLNLKSWLDCLRGNYLKTWERRQPVRKKSSYLSQLKSWLPVACMLCIFIGTAYAGTDSGGDLPFNTTIDKFQSNFTSWIAIAVVLLWIATTLMLAFGEWGDGMKKLLNILFWVALCLSGGTVVPIIFGTGAVI